MAENQSDRPKRIRIPETTTEATISEDQPPKKEGPETVIGRIRTQHGVFNTWVGAEFAASVARHRQRKAEEAEESGEKKPKIAGVLLKIESRDTRPYMLKAKIEREEPPLTPRELVLVQLVQKLRPYYTRRNPGDPRLAPKKAKLVEEAINALCSADRTFEGGGIQVLLRSCYPQIPEGPYLDQITRSIITLLDEDRPLKSLLEDFFTSRLDQRPTGRSEYVWHGPSIDNNEDQLLGELHGINESGDDD